MKDWTKIESYVGTVAWSIRKNNRTEEAVRASVFTNMNRKIKRSYSAGKGRFP